MTINTPSSVKKHRESTKPENPAPNGFVWIYHSGFHTKATFSLSSAWPITYSQLWSQARCLIETTHKVLWLHLSRHFQTLYACAKTVTWQLSSEVAGRTVRVLCWTLCERFDFCKLWTVEHCIMNNYGNSYGIELSYQVGTVSTAGLVTDMMVFVSDFVAASGC